VSSIGRHQRELSDAAVLVQAQALASYLEKPGNRGAKFWLDSKDFAPADRAAVLVALRDLEDEACA
jgi:hypothetical protein